MSPAQKRDLRVSLLIPEHRLIAPDNLTRLGMAFFRVNSLVSASLFLKVIAGLF